MRYRGKHKGHSKIKLEHSLIPGLRKLLEELQVWPEIHSIIPGEIKRRGGSNNQLILKVQYPTTTGVKCIARAAGCVQEVFFVGSSKERLHDKLLKQFGS